MSGQERALGPMSAAIAAALLAVAGPAAAQKAQYSSKDIIDTFANKPAAQGTAAQGTCEQRGMATGDDGVCEPMKDSRGFSLPTRANLHPGAPASTAAAAARPAASHGAAPAARSRQVASIAPRAAAATEPHRNLLISFKLGSADLTDQAKANARVFAEALNSPALKDAKFDVSGYTDASGDPAKNTALSQSRAEAVKSFLVAQGVASDRLEATGHGSSDLAVPSAPTSPKNRRVEARRIN